MPPGKTGTKKQDLAEEIARAVGAGRPVAIETEEKKIFHLVPPLAIARAWQGRHRRNMVSDYDQAMVLIGACFDGSGINASETLKNENFKPHPALGALLEWHGRRAASQNVRNAAARALAIFQVWEHSHPGQVAQLSIFYGG